MDTNYGEIDMSTSTLQKGQIVTLLTSYCGDKGCTDRHPCKECIPMCNTFELTGKVIAKYKGQVDKVV
jgi:hypothetical protein